MNKLKTYSVRPDEVSGCLEVLIHSDEYPEGVELLQQWVDLEEIEQDMDTLGIPAWTPPG